MRQKRGEVGSFHYFQEIVGGVVFQAVYCRRRIVERDARIFQKFRDFVFAEAFCGGVPKEVAFAEKRQAEYAPHVVYGVWVEEVHAPFFALWRKGAEHQGARGFRQKRIERVGFHAAFQQLSAPEFKKNCGSARRSLFSRAPRREAGERIS